MLELFYCVRRASHDCDCWNAMGGREDGESGAEVKIERWRRGERMLGGIGPLPANWHRKRLPRWWSSASSVGAYKLLDICSTARIAGIAMFW
jgi:hypothetical protein